MKEIVRYETKEIVAYEKACEAIKDKFKKKYFKDAYDDSFWVGDKIGGIFYISDYYFDIDFMITALRYKATEDQLFDYYNADLEFAMNGKKKSKFNFENYLRYPDNFILDFLDGEGYKFIVK